MIHKYNRLDRNINQDRKLQYIYGIKKPKWKTSHDCFGIFEKVDNIDA